MYDWKLDVYLAYLWARLVLPLSPEPKAVSLGMVMGHDFLRIYQWINPYSQGTVISFSTSDLDGGLEKHFLRFISIDPSCDGFEDVYNINDTHNLAISGKFQIQ